MSEANGEAPRVLPIVGGVLLLPLSLALAGLAWTTYERGVPGVPDPLPDQAGAIVVYAPPDVRFDALINFRQKGAWYNAKAATDEVSVQLIFRTARSTPFVVVAGFYGDARLTDSGASPLFELDEATFHKYDPRRLQPLGKGNRPFEGPEAPGSKVIQYIHNVAEEGKAVGNTILLGGGALAHPVFASVNARTVVRTKLFDEVARCSALGDPKFVASFSPERWIEAGLPTCQSGVFIDSASHQLNRGQKTEISLTTTVQVPRLDFASSPVSSGLTISGWPLSWNFPGGIPARVRASYTDLDEEARGQSSLFLSGVAVGLATSIFPGSMTLIVNRLNMHRKWRKRTR